MSVSDIDLVNTFTNYMISVRAGSSSTLYTDKINDIQTQIYDITTKLSVLDGQEETYNEKYISAKEHPVKFGLFGNTQDWVLAYFYISYFVFSILVILMILKNSKTRGMAALLSFGILFLLTIVITYLLILFA
jgi:hypothetical protein